MRWRPYRRIGRLLIAASASIAVAACLGSTSVKPTSTPPSSAVPASAPPPRVSTLILYDTSGSTGWLGELYAQLTANLLSHFGTWTARPVATYHSGDMAKYQAVVYLGTSTDETLSTAFLTDVVSTSLPVLWVDSNIWQLTSSIPDFVARYGFSVTDHDYSRITRVMYKGTTLDRDPHNGNGVVAVTIVDKAKVTERATAIRDNGTRMPWAITSRNLTYIAETPYNYVTPNDRYIAFTDLLFTVLAPPTAERHRALVRLEDVGPDADPAKLRAVAKYLNQEKIPYSVAVYPLYRNPLGAKGENKAKELSLTQTPAVVSALKYMVSHGGTILMHGYTHQYSNVDNPYSGASGDYEFLRAHADNAHSVQIDGPVPENSYGWALDRLRRGEAIFAKVGLPVPSIFVFPNYAGSLESYQAVANQFSTRYERATYFSGLLSGRPLAYDRSEDQFFPYTVKDVFGTIVIPENLGFVDLVPSPFDEKRLPADVVYSAKVNLVVRDGVASFFYHPFLGAGPLSQTVSGIRKLGYQFVSAQSMANLP